MFIAPIIILTLALVAWAAYEANSTVRGRHAAQLQAIADNPADYVRARMNEEAPHQFERIRTARAATADLAEAKGKAASIGKELPSDPPARKWVVVVAAFSALWVIAFLVQFLLDFRIAHAVTGQTGSAALTALVVSGLLGATTLAAALLLENRATVKPVQLRLGLVIAAALFVAVLAVVVGLAPKRAEMDYATEMDRTKQSIAMFREDNDTTAVELTEAQLARLEKKRDQAKSFYQAIAVAAGVLEGGTSLAVPTGYLLLNYYGAQALVRRRTKEETEASNAVPQGTERFMARISRKLETAGVGQDLLGRLLGGAGGGPTPGGPPPGLNRPPIALPGPEPTMPSEPTPRPPVPPVPPVTPSVPPVRPRPVTSNEPDDGPDPTFDQS